MTDPLSISQLVRSVAAQHPDVADPKQLVPYFMEAIEGREQEALERIAGPYIGQILRRRGPATADEIAQWRSLMEERIPTSDGYVFGRDATADDLDEGAARRRRFSGALDARAGMFTAAAEAMRRSAAATAKDLSLDEGAAAVRAAAEMKRLRIRDRRTTRKLPALREAVNELRALANAGCNPRIQLLRGYRDDLVVRREELLAQLDVQRRMDSYEETVLRG